MKSAVAPFAQEVPPTALDEVVAQLNDAYIEKGTPMFMRTVLALFSGGFATFALLYCVQPMMPALSHEFSINAAQSSLVLSVSTATLAHSFAALFLNLFVFCKLIFRKHSFNFLVLLFTLWPVLSRKKPQTVRRSK